MLYMANSYLSPDLLRGKTIFVTGGGSGINLGIGHVCASLGANIAICGRSAERLEGARTQLALTGAKVFTAVADVRQPAALAEAFDRCANELGPIDGLVCGAAGNFVCSAETMSPNGFGTVIGIDLLGSFNAAHAAFAQLQQTRGSLLFVSAAQSFSPMAYQLHAGAAKAGIENMMRNLALEWGPYGIRSNSIVPGPIADTEGASRMTEGLGEQFWDTTVPLGRRGRVEEVGAMAAILLSPLAAYITGAQVVVDGGQCLAGSALYNQQIGAQLAAQGAAQEPAA